MRNLHEADLSHETKSPPDSPHVGSFTNRNQPDSYLDDGSMNLEPRNKKNRSESENLSSTVETNHEFETPSNNETSSAQPSPPTVLNLQLKFGKKGNDDLPPEKNGDCDTRKCKFFGIVYQFFNKRKHQNKDKFYCEHCIVNLREAGKRRVEKARLQKKKKKFT